MSRDGLSAMLILLVACSQVNPQEPVLGGSVSLPRVVKNTSACNVILYFNGANGADPAAGLVVRGQLLYGTTARGGYGDGTLFSLTPSGQETVVHDFYQEGIEPSAPVTPLSKKLYGTTAYGGTSGQGTVFAIKTNGKVLWTYSFKGDAGKDGDLPAGAPVEVSGMLYGTTANGSTGNSGVAYRITPSGAERVIYRFNGKQGRMPYGNLIEFHKTLWGTTEQGGIAFGTVFSITTSGKLTTVYKFKGASNSDGENPYAGLVEIHGTLYGTTEYGGPNNTGTVFSVTATGQERVIYSFGASSSGDGTHPVSALFVYDGNLYGTTLDGGPYNDGTVFEVTPSGAEQPLCSFDQSGSTGIAHPGGSVVELDGRLYGTAEFGGPDNSGGVFSLSPGAARQSGN
jgi:uncharacterized repeat protein (TIGR03803 family)